MGSNKYAPLLDERDEYGWGDGEHTDKKKENITCHQNQLPADIQRSMAKDICSVHIEHAWANKGEKEGCKKQDFVAFQHQQSHSKEIRVTLSTWSFERVRVKAE